MVCALSKNMQDKYGYNMTYGHASEAALLKKDSLKKMLINGLTWFSNLTQIGVQTKKKIFHHGSDFQYVLN